MIFPLKLNSQNCVIPLNEEYAPAFHRKVVLALLHRPAFDSSGIQDCAERFDHLGFDWFPTIVESSLSLSKLHHVAATSRTRRRPSLHRQIHRPHFSRRLLTIFNKNSHTEIFKEVLIHPERLLGLQVQGWLGCGQIAGCREEGVTEGGCDWTPGSYPGSSGSSRQQQLSFLAPLSSRQHAAQLPQSRHILT